MSVMIETTVGTIVLDLFTEQCPVAAKNFLKLCKIKYYNNVLIFNVQQNFIIQTGDPTGTGKGGTSIYGILYGDQAKFFEDELLETVKIDKKGLFFITARGDDMEHLNGKHTILGEVAEGLEVVDKLNDLYVDEDGRPYQDIRILHTYILDDPFPDPPQLEVPGASPPPGRPKEETVAPRLTEEDLKDEGRTAEEIEKSLKDKEAKSRAVVLEMIGDLPDADVKPPEDVLFVAKLNPVTTDEDLAIIFSQFGEVRKAEIIRDYKTGDSLCYGFIEFTDRDACEKAYFKMDNCLVDDRRIKVDFSQSVAKLWNKFARRPWEKHSKEDEDPYELEKGKPGFGKNIELKTRYQHNRGGGKYQILDDDGMEDSGRRKRHQGEGRDQDRHRHHHGSSKDTISRSERGRSRSKGARSPSPNRSDRNRRRSPGKGERDRGRRNRSRSTSLNRKRRRSADRDRRRSRSPVHDDRRRRWDR